MIPVLFIRHGVTQWNADRRIQGQTDVPLSSIGRQQVASQGIPTEFKDFRWVSSPLIRAAETARLLGGTGLVTDWRLAEMRWGAWEGRTLSELRDTHGDEMLKSERRGLDFNPPGGETPRRVQERLKTWLADTRQAGVPVIAVTHKGVIRAALALATGWNMLGKPPHRLDWRCGHLFAVRAEHDLVIERVNIELTPGETSTPQRRGREKNR